MLSTNPSSSSIQKRRQLHRRQQSLEVPILATPLPAKPRRNQSAHRRGLSLDQSMSAANQSPAAFRPLLSQDQQRPSPTVRIQLDTTNIGPPPDTKQHFEQATQQHSLAQPGYQAQDFQSHLQHQLNGSFRPSPADLPQTIIDSPLSPAPIQRTALEELQNHMAWYQSNFGQSQATTMPPVAMQSAAYFDPNQLAGVQMAAVPMPMAAHAMPMQMPGRVMTPVARTHARTVPNTPQSYATQAWPSPPPTQHKHMRSQSFQLDVAPMPGHFEGAPTHAGQNAHYNDQILFTANDNRYAGSNYSASITDPTSPTPNYPNHQMPTLFEEPSPPLDSHSTQIVYNVPPPLLLQATAGSSRNFIDQDYDFEGPIPVSPRQALINNLGPQIPASIVDTGIPAHEIQQFIGEQDESDSRYACLWEGCNRRFGRKENVRAHVQTHLGDRQFKCDLCDKTFVRQHDLKRHIAIHSDDRPFICPCSQGFARHDALTRHRQRGMCSGALPGFEKTEEEKPKRGRPKKQRPDMESRLDKSIKTRKANRDRQTVSSLTHDNITNNHTAMDLHYASSSSAASDRSYPVTPPETSDDFDADIFLHMAAAGDHHNHHHAFDSVTTSWRDTPPTSPATARSSSPAKTLDAPFDFSAPLPPPQGISPALLASNHSSPASSQHHYDFAASAVTPPASQGGAYAPFTGSSSPAEYEYEDFGYGGPTAQQPDVVGGAAADVFSPAGESNSGSSVFTEEDLFAFGEQVMEMGGFGGLKGGLTMVEERGVDDMLEEWGLQH